MSGAAGEAAGAVPARPPEDELEVEPYSRGELVFHLTGGALNGVVWLAAVGWLAAGWAEHRPAWLGVVAAVAAGLYLADLASGILHWAFDTWFSPEVVQVRRMVLKVREHHIYPGRIFKHSFTEDAGVLSWIALLVLAPLLAWAAIAGPAGLAGYALCAAVVFDPLLVFMLEFHKCGHRPRGPAWVRALQRVGLVLPVGHHLRHHSGNHDDNYCTINGWADKTLGRIGFFRGLEWAIHRLTRAYPQDDDHAFLRRHGKRVVGRRGLLPTGPYRRAR